ncbi:Putative conjugal transfer protein [Maioricimonas rarisocia]|uniref:Conjugal transfer protein n=1 Tax=Maioricimonas rarisocia TaxID=2528026 RepID=A0A517Z461_9PLAN|nr:ATPase, T2SS/T4P/T4SS family [Maioricimonas rarisocia]QDU37272.1 Putative conjugal transfer protein [Maioricimonas rarisocia]
MKIWYNKVHEGRRSVMETENDRITIGRDGENSLVLNSPLVSKRQAVVTRSNGKLLLENVGINSCMIGDDEVFGGQSRELTPGETVRIWPYTITFETDQAARISRQEMEAHLRTLMSDLETRVHRKLLERFDLYELESNRLGDADSILLLENHIEDVCRELNLFAQDNDPLLEEIIGLTLRDYVINQLILESDDERFRSNRLTWNEFDVPATLVPERETELENLLMFTRERLKLDEQPDLSARIRRTEAHFGEVFPLIRPHLHRELRKYLILRTLKKELKDTVFGYGPLQDLLRAPTITEIMVVKRDQIYVERDGVVELSGRRFISDKVTESIIERIVAQVGRRIDKSQPLVDARLPDGSRVNAIIPPLAVRGPCVTIRKFPAYRFTIDDLIEMGTVTQAAAMFLRACVVDRRNVLVSGGTGTGKTTLLNILSSFIPHRERIVTIEDTQELQLHQDHVVTLETKPPNVEGAGEYSIRDLVKNALRMRPDRILVGECRSGEALDMLQAMNTGHDGSMTTVHANSSEEVIKRLEVLVLMAVDLPVASIHRQIASALDVIVQISRESQGRRVITQISEVAGYDPDRKELVIHDIFNYRNGESLTPTGYLPTFVNSLIDRQLLQLEFLYGKTGVTAEEQPEQNTETTAR